MLIFALCLAEALCLLQEVALGRIATLVPHPHWSHLRVSQAGLYPDPRWPGAPRLLSFPAAPRGGHMARTGHPTSGSAGRPVRLKRNRTYRNVLRCPWHAPHRRLPTAIAYLAGSFLALRYPFGGYSVPGGKFLRHQSPLLPRNRRKETRI
jgi:hypothetical protein